MFIVADLLSTLLRFNSIYRLGRKPNVYYMWWLTFAIFRIATWRLAGVLINKQLGDINLLEIFFLLSRWEQIHMLEWIIIKT